MKNEKEQNITIDATPVFEEIEKLQEKVDNLEFMVFVMAGFVFTAILSIFSGLDLQLNNRNLFFVESFKSGVAFYLIFKLIIFLEEIITWNNISTTISKFKKSWKRETLISKTLIILGIPSFFLTIFQILQLFR